MCSEDSFKKENSALCVPIQPELFGSAFMKQIAVFDMSNISFRRKKGERGKDEITNNKHQSFLRKVPGNPFVEFSHVHA